MQSETAGSKEEGKHKAAEKETTIRRFLPIRTGLRQASSAVRGLIGQDDVLVHARAEEPVFMLIVGS